MTQTRYRLLDMSRGLAAIVILFWHYQHFYFTEAGSGPQIENLSIMPLYGVFEYFYRFGYAAVYFFWVLSGFVLASAYWDNQTSLADFTRRRVARIYPLHLLTLIAVAVLQAISLLVLEHWQIYGYNDWYHFILHLGLMSDWGFQEGYAFNAPIWSVSLEVVIYVAFFFSLPLIRRLGFFFPLIASAFFLSLQLLAVPGAFWWCGFHFFVGAFIFGAWRKFSQQQIVIFPLSMLLMITGIIGLSIVDWSPPMTTDNVNLFYASFAPLFAGIILLLAALEKFTKNFDPTWLGDVSFGIYLWHIPVQIVALILMQLNGWEEAPTSPIFLAGFIALVMAIAHVSYKFYERPAREQIRLFGFSMPGQKR